MPFRHRFSFRPLVASSICFITSSFVHADVGVQFGYTSARPQPGFLRMTTNDPGHTGTFTRTFGGVDKSACPGGSLTVTMSGGAVEGTTTQSALFRNRVTPLNSGNFTNGPIYQGFGGYSLTAGTFLWLKLDGLAPNGQYRLALYSYDDSYSSSSTFTDVTAGSYGTSYTFSSPAGYNFAASANGNNAFASTILVSADATGKVILKSTGTINALSLSPSLPAAVSAAAPVNVAPPVYGSVGVQCGYDNGVTLADFPYRVQTNDPGHTTNLSRTFTGVTTNITNAGTMTVTLSGGATAGTTTQPTFFRDRVSPASSGALTYGALLRNFAGYSLTTGNYLWVDVGGLKPNTPYFVTLYAYDNYSGSSMTFADYTAGSAGDSGSCSNAAYYNSSDPNIGSDAYADDRYGVTIFATSSSTGSLRIRGNNPTFTAGIINGFKLATGYGEANLVDNTGVVDRPGSPNGSYLNVGEAAVDANNSRAFIPIAVPGGSVNSVQSAAAIMLDFYLKSFPANPGCSIDVYGLPAHAATRALAGDYAAVGGLAPIANLVPTATGWQEVDVTKFVQEQVDAVQPAAAGASPAAASACFVLVFKGATLPNTDGQQTAFVIASSVRGPATAPRLNIQIDHADTTTLDNGVYAGYQGWFKAPTDGIATNWGNWANNSGVISATNLQVDLWPDMSLYSANEKYATGLTFPGGAAAPLFSNNNYRTVLRHCAWMSRYGIDGLFLGQFANYLPGGYYNPTGPRDVHMKNFVRDAAASTGRSWAMSYDVSGTNSNLLDIIKNDWKHLVDNGYTSSAGYLHQNGVPVIEIWGFYAHVAGSADKSQLSDLVVANQLIDFFHTPGPYQAYFIGSGPWWFSEPATISANPDWFTMIQRLDAFVPWNPGHLGTSGGVVKAAVSTWQRDINTYPNKWIPTIFPGFSDVNRGGNVTPRRRGAFLWEQYKALAALTPNPNAPKANTVFLAMFDEFNEGTGIMPASVQLPAGSNLINYDEGVSPSLPTTSYMQWVGWGQYYLKTQQSFPTNAPSPVPY
jgi:hypothetical protein